MAFFRKGNDELAKNIALEGKSWSKTFWRKEDMISYQFRCVQNTDFFNLVRR
jgi:hypothetical protein